MLSSALTVNLEIFVIKIFVARLPSEIIYTSKEEEYRHQSKQVRSTLPHEAINQYGGGILERYRCVGGSTCIKTHGILMRAVGEVLIYEPRVDNASVLQKTH